MLGYRHEVWWTSGDASFGPPDAAELRVTTFELASFSNSFFSPEGWYVVREQLSRSASKGLPSVNRVLCKRLPFLITSFSLFPFPFIWGQGKGLQKRSSILAEVLMMLEIQLWTIDPHIPLSKMRPPNRILGSPTALSQIPALGEVCLLKH